MPLGKLKGGKYDYLDIWISYQSGVPCYSVALGEELHFWGGIKMLVNKLMIAGALAVAVSACTPHNIYRNDAETYGKVSPKCVFEPANITRDETGKSSSDKDKNQCALEHHTFRYNFKDFSGKEDPNIQGSYYLSFVELDDQGWLWDRRQMESLLRFLNEKSNEKIEVNKELRKQEFLIFTFAHGWQHSSRGCDSNVICFKRLLERFAAMESASTRSANDRRAKEAKDEGKDKYDKVVDRIVIGVYTGWRGRSVEVPLIDNATFWDRKSTAKGVGLGGMTELLSKLNDFRDFRNSDREPLKTQLIIIGHSFGGMVVYSALAHSLVERAGAMTGVGEDEDNQKFKFDVAKSFGDLVVLVNPAFEGSLYEPIFDAATHRCYAGEQRPVMVIATSKADAATKVAFPAGQFFDTAFETLRDDKLQGAQREAMLNTIGHNDRYTTHHLSLRNPKPKKEDGDDVALIENKGDCTCKFLDPLKEYNIALNDPDGIIEGTFLKETAEAATKREEGKNGKLKLAAEYTIGKNLDQDSVTYGDDLILEKSKKSKFAHNYPYFVVSTSAQIMEGHNEIYDENFIDFMRRFYVKHVKYRVNFPKQCFISKEGKKGGICDFDDELCGVSLDGA